MESIEPTEGEVPFASFISLKTEIHSLRTTGREVILLNLENPKQELSLFFLGKTIEGLRILQRVFESAIPMFVNHDLSHGQTVSPIFMSILHNNT